MTYEKRRGPYGILHIAVDAARHLCGLRARSRDSEKVIDPSNTRQRGGPLSACLRDTADWSVRWAHEDSERRELYAQRRAPTGQRA